METFSRLFKNLDIKGLQTYNPIKYKRRVIEIKIPEIKKYYFNRMFNTTQTQPQLFSTYVLSVQSQHRQVKEIRLKQQVVQ
ncbi:hypothetical protein TTHERM_000304273 (macronuclear) [Tetrahymena thermophila SB210]|uniref:Uncharacterized protein n=1 Tax=Tetrahymena thermophila (strain SB210) TaxID=312017 RepID=W7X6X4_TETTS|nr:hypothetical protein TTHERM_000304273 [Tetrahymena thermophila SB210]EWS73117.1 hypothetical protein TTHERM_000304273 [Tetrahymena thermophila SB210]|eukprot:XP_012654304.1 hypothetical protein TTHERM_000304273 [Tetrahymena thermophila SB210]